MKNNVFPQLINTHSIRGQLFWAFILIALLAFIGNTTSSFVIGYIDEKEQAHQQLEAVALSKSLQLKTWSNDRQNELIVILSEEYAAERMENVLTMASEDKFLEFVNGAVRQRLYLFNNSSEEFFEFFLIDLEGNVCLSTETGNEGINYKHELFFINGLERPFVQLPFDPQQENILISRPVYSENGQTLGVLAGKTRTDTLIVLMLEKTGMGNQSQSFLLSENNVILEVLKSSPGFSTRKAENAYLSQIPTSDPQFYPDLYQNKNGSWIISVVHWLDDYNTSIVIEQSLTAVMKTVFSALRINLIITAVVILLSILVSSLISRNITNPIINLSKTASQIATGNLNQQAEEKNTGNELDILASAFNSMTQQLQNAFRTLEQRVEERTFSLQEANEALALQTIQLNANAHVSREITSILDLDHLLKRVAGLINTAFDLDEVNIYLLDKEQKKLRVKASTRSEFFPYSNNSINDEVMKIKQPLHIQGMGSEKDILIIPLRFSDQILGTLDIRKQARSAFNEQNQLIFQSLADQIAVAIKNAYLYNQSRELAVLEERDRLAKDLHDSVTQSLYSLNLMVEGWRLSSSPINKTTFDNNLQRVGEIVQQMLVEMRLMIYEMRPPVLAEAGLLVALRKRLDAVEKRTGLQTKFRIEIFDRFSPEIEENLFYIAQEALNNVLKHAAASLVTIHLFKQEKNLYLKIQDNGQGFENNIFHQNNGYGLPNMHERCEKN